jgi:hypothetical protein
VTLTKAKELALIPELEVSEGFVCSSGWLTNFKKRHGISSGPAWRGRLGSEASVQLLRPSSKLLEALPDKDGENPVNVQPEDTFNMDESAWYYGQVVRWREGGLQK